MSEDLSFVTMTGVGCAAKAPDGKTGSVGTDSHVLVKYYMGRPRADRSKYIDKPYPPVMRWLSRLPQKMLFWGVKGVCVYRYIMHSRFQRRASRFTKPRSVLIGSSEVSRAISHISSD